jgi:hypothetical protein
MRRPPASGEAEPDRSPASWRRVAAAMLALLCLNGLLSFRSGWPAAGIVPDHRLAPEFVALWLLLLAAVALRGAFPRAMVSAVAAAYLALVLGRGVDVIVPGLFGRPVNLYWDGAQVPRFLWVTAQELPWWQSAGLTLALALLLWALYRLLRWAIEVAAHEAAPYALRARWTWVVTTGAVLLVAAGVAGAVPRWPVVAKPVTPTYWQQAALLLNALSPQRRAELLPKSSAVDAALAAPNTQPLGALAGRDLYVIMLESYGAVVYDEPRAATALRPRRQELDAAIVASGRRVVSAFVRSPTFGGASDLAQLGLLSGIDLSDPIRHDLLLTTDRPTLMTLFGANGYQSYGVYPAVSWEWPERAFYGYDVYLDGRDLDYRGPALGYWRIPDQVALALFEQAHPRGPHAPPRFVFFPTITSHMPFRPVPPVQSDWARLLTPQPFDAAELQRALAEEVDWLDLFPDYVRVFDYTYRWLAGFFGQAEPRETVYVIVGDHQPMSAITGESSSWDVPVHVVSRDPALLERFVALGFHPGLEPPRPAVGALHDLTGMLLCAFSQPRLQTGACPAPPQLADARAHSDRR